MYDFREKETGMFAKTIKISAIVLVVLTIIFALATLIWGKFWVFFITSVLAAGVESMFVIMQRYNRPRIIKMIEKERKRKA